jgi:hypothetical protein
MLAPLVLITFKTTGEELDEKDCKFARFKNGKRTGTETSWVCKEQGPDMTKISSCRCLGNEI